MLADTIVQASYLSWLSWYFSNISWFLGFVQIFKKWYIYRFRFTYSLINYCHFRELTTTTRPVLFIELDQLAYADLNVVYNMTCENIVHYISEVVLLNANLVMWLNTGALPKLTTWIGSCICTFMALICSLYLYTIIHRYRLFLNKCKIASRWPLIRSSHEISFCLTEIDIMAHFKNHDHSITNDFMF